MTAILHAIKDFYVASTAVVTGNVALGPGVNIWFSCVLRGDLATITIEPRVNIQDGCIVHTDTDAPMTIGEGVVVGHGAILHGTKIGRDTLIGMGARLLSGCEIGEECLIAAGTLVTEGRRIPPRSVVMGIPGKVIRAITDEELERTRTICAHYLEMAQRYVRAPIRPRGRADMISSTDVENRMSVPEPTRMLSPASEVSMSLATPMDRRADVEVKQTRIAALLQEIGCDGLLVLDPDNFAWLTAGGTSRGILDPDAFPALYFTPDARWLLASNVDTQRLFDEEIDGLGFQLKEWPWHQERGQLLADLCQGRNVASDMPMNSNKVVATQLQHMRRTLTDYEIACYRTLGQTLSHALEATGRTLSVGESEREIAGQISHRLMHRGVQPLLVSVSADGRGRAYRQAAFTSTPITHNCVMTVAARKYGLCARASRSVSFGQPDANFRRDHDCACKISATYVAGSWPDSVPRQILLTGQRIFQLTGVEHEFFLAPQGHLTGHAPVELSMGLHDEQLLQAHWAITWCVAVGAAVSCDTFLISDEGPRAITAAENWPLKRIRIQGAEFVRPDVLIR